MKSGKNDIELSGINSQPPSSPVKNDDEKIKDHINRTALLWGVVLVLIFVATQVTVAWTVTKHFAYTNVQDSVRRILLCLASFDIEL